MKTLQSCILEGLRQNIDSFEFDFEHDNEQDIIKLRPAELKKLNIGDDVFLYQYEFESVASSEIRTKFFDHFRFGEAFSSSEDKKNFLEFAVQNLLKAIKINEFDAIVFPKSRSIINQEIIKRITSLNRLSVATFELIKELPQNIEFDFNAFKSEILDSEHSFHGKSLSSYTEKQKSAKLEKIQLIVDSIKKSDYFSIASSVNGNDLKQYFENFLKFKSKEDSKLFEAIQTGSILIIDDVTTTGSTIKDIIKTIRKVNPEHRIVIFSIIGKNF